MENEAMLTGFPRGRYYELTCFNAMVDRIKSVGFDWLWRLTSNIQCRSIFRYCSVCLWNNGIFSRENG